MDLDAFEGKYRILQNWFCCFAFHLRNECKIVFFFWAKVLHPTILTLRAFFFFRNLCYNIIESLILREKEYMILVEKEYEIPSKLQNKKNQSEKWRERERGWDFSRLIVNLLLYQNLMIAQIEIFFPAFVGRSTSIRFQIFG